MTTVPTHVNINGGLFEAEVELSAAGLDGVITVMDLPTGQVRIQGEEFPVIVGGRSGKGRVRTIAWQSDRRTRTTIDFDLDAT